MLFSILSFLWSLKMTNKGSLDPSNVTESQTFILLLQIPVHITDTVLSRKTFIVNLGPTYKSSAVCSVFTEREREIDS